MGCANLVVQDYTRPIIDDEEIEDNRVDRFEENGKPALAETENQNEIGLHWRIRTGHPS